MKGVFLALGSNMGDRENFLDKAVELIAENIGDVVKQSTIIETEPWGKTDQSRFLNMVIEIETDLSPDELLKECQDVEERLGRVRKDKWGERTIDVDILLYGDQKVDRSDLKIPHPLMWERDFVVEPLTEIAPDIVDRFA